MVSPSHSPSESEPVRASVRFPLQLNVLLMSEEREYAATTVNVSANGVLFVGEDLPEAETRVRFRLRMPAEVMGGAEDVVLDCVGRIVRNGTHEGRPAAAAEIDEYSLKAEHV